LTAPKVIHRAAIVDPAGIGALLRAIEDYDGLPLTKAALKLACGSVHILQFEGT
jgi:hypothetical protein